ncbi:hypothetical protein CDL60_03640 [Roseateles noduli]|nr:hypothetical protein CDL60_03640 [Roseateles noduli]
MWETTVAETPRRVCAADVGILSQTAQEGMATTDQGPALRAALAQLGKQGAALFLPSGRYAFAGELQLPGGTGLVGSATGNTRLESVDAAPARITTDISAATGVLIEGLQLHNTRIVVDGIPPSTVRWNGLTGTHGKEAQITVARGRHTVEGNVLRRSGDVPGFGIDLRTTGGTTADQDTAGSPTSKVCITRNLIGAVDADWNPVRSDRHIAPRTRAMLLAMRRSPADSAERNGHYLVAIRSMLAVPLEIAYNRVALSAPDQTSAAAESPRAAAQILSPRHMEMSRNSFNAIGFNTRKVPPVYVDTPSDALIGENHFEHVPLILIRSGHFPGPVKKTVIWDNRLNDAPMALRVAVSGMGAQHTSPDDVEIRANHFWAAPRCALTMLKPEAGTRNFATIENYSTPRDNDLRGGETVPCL